MARKKVITSKSAKLPVLPIDVLVSPSELSLSAEQRKVLEECEVIISRGWLTFLEVGQALIKIRDYQGGVLFKQSYGTFEKYCQERWEFGRSHAYRLMNAARIADILSPRGDTSVLPTSEKQLRPLVALGDDAELVQKVWCRANELAEGKELLSRHVTKAVREVLPPDKKGRKSVPPTKTLKLAVPETKTFRRHLTEIEKELARAHPRLDRLRKCVAEMRELIE